MKLTSEELRKLQKYWYKILAKDGFKDIEMFKGNTLVLIQSASHCYSCTDKESRIAKEEYYRAIAKAALDENAIYRNEVDRFILIRHSEGANAKVIVEELKFKGTPRNRHSVRFIIRRYQMAWGFRHYTANQLNKKIK